MRPMVVAVAALAALGATAICLPPTPPARCPGQPLPPTALGGRVHLNRRGCNIAGARNVLSADFTGTGSAGWAVLCRQGRSPLCSSMAGWGPKPPS